MSGSKIHYYHEDDELEEEVCPLCEGDGRLICDACKGSGLGRSEDGRCPICDGRGEVICECMMRDPYWAGGPV